MPDEHQALAPSLGKSTTAVPSLTKQHSWSPSNSRDKLREEAWRKRQRSTKRRSKSVTDEDIDELQACIELGFGFDTRPGEPVDQRLCKTFPALELLYAVNKLYNDSISKSTNATATPASSSAASDCDTASPVSSPLTIFRPGENPKTMKTRLRQWARVFAFFVKQISNKE